MIFKAKCINEVLKVFSSSILLLLKINIEVTSQDVFTGVTLCGELCKLVYFIIEVLIYIYTSSTGEVDSCNG